MEEEIKFSRQYHEMFDHAAKIKNVEEMTRIFREMAAEAGLKDTQSDASQAAWGKKVAEYLNNRGKGPECKKL